MNKSKGLPFRIRNGRWHADFQGATLPQYINLPDINSLPEVQSNLRIRFSLGVTETASIGDVWRVFSSALDRRFRQEEYLTVDDAFDRVLAYKKNSGYSDQSYVEHKRISGNFTNLCKRRSIKLLSKITPELLADYRSEKISLGRKPTGVNTDLDQLRNLFKLLDQWGLMPQGFDSATWITPIKTKRPEKRWRIITPPELDLALSDPDFGDIFSWLYYSGARIGVILQLREQDVNREEKIVTYPPGKQGKILKQPFIEDMENFLETHSPQSERGFLFWRDKWGDPFSVRDRRNAENAVNRRLKYIIVHQLYSHLVNRYVGKTDPDETRKSARELYKELDLPKTHDFRATRATGLIDLGVDPLAIVSFIGWEDPGVFWKYYYRRKPQDLKIPSVHSQPGSNVQQIGKRKKASEG